MMLIVLGEGCCAWRIISLAAEGWLTLWVGSRSLTNFSTELNPSGPCLQSENRKVYSVIEKKSQNVRYYAQPTREAAYAVTASCTRRVMITHSLQEGLKILLSTNNEHRIDIFLSPLGQRHKMACRDNDAPDIMLRPAKETVQPLAIILAPVETFVSDHF